MANMIRAILIDPQKRNVTETQIKGDDIKETQRILCCHSFTSGAHLGGSIEKGFDAVYVSDDYLEDRDEADLRFWFQVDADRDPPSSFPIAGLGLAHGVDPEGNCCDVTISVAELASRVTFTRRKFRGFAPTTVRHSGRGTVAIEVGLKAPIIDTGDDNG